jgi:DNA-binding SARP family transcriptional activator
LGEFETAEKYYRTAREVFDGWPDFRRRAAGALIDIPYTYTLFIKGELEQSQRLNEKVLKSLLELNIEISLPMVYSQRSVIRFFFGEYAKGVENASKGIEICEKLSLSDNQKGWVYLAWAQNCLGLNKLDEAAQLIDRAVAFFEDPGNRWGLANAWDCLHRVYLAQGKFELARRILNRAIHIIDGYGLRSTEGILGNSLAGLLMIENDFSQASNCLENAKTKLAGVDFYLFENHLLTAKCHVKSGRADRAVRPLSQGLRLSERKGYDRFVKKEASWIVPLLRDTLSNKRAITGKPRAYLERLFKTEISQKPPGLNIVLLGRFKLTIGDKDIPSSRWKSSKALMIFKYLAANRRKGFIPREALIEMLWPNEEIRKTGARFNMAMSALRKTLEPQLTPRQASAYLTRKKDTYRLNGDVTINIDTEHFTNALKSAKTLKNQPQKALEYYLLAESLYQGPFLEEDRYEEWCTGKKERYASDYLMMLKAIEAIYEKQKDIESTALYSQKILKADPFDENALGKLMTLHAASGNLTEIRRMYENHIKAAEEMDCPVRAEITKMYKRLTIQGSI